MSKQLQQTKPYMSRPGDQGLSKRMIIISEIVVIQIQQNTFIRMKIIKALPYIVTETSIL